MSVNKYQESSLGWQVQQLQQRIGEWWENLTRKGIETADNSVPSNWLDWLNEPWFHNVVKALLWIVLAVIIVALLWLLWQEFKPYFFWLLTGKRPDLSSPSTNDVSVSKENWAAKAEKYYRQGDYQQACLCLYQAMLQRVDQKEIVSYQASLTDGEYWSFLRPLPSSASYQTLLDIHQDLCFGGVIASLETWQLCHTAYGEIENK
jgi:hypothetical protein